MTDNEKTALEYSGMVDPTDYIGMDSSRQKSEPPPLTKAFMDAKNGNRVNLGVQLLPHFPANRVLKRATPGSSGIDVFAAIDSPKKLNIIGSRALIPTGIKVEVPVGYEIQVRPKSGLANKYGVTVLNTPGTVDSDYRGEVGVILILLSQGKFVIEPGMKIAQIVVTEVATPRTDIVLVDELSDTDRGEGGFGSTGS